MMSSQDAFVRGMIPARNDMLEDSGLRSGWRENPRTSGGSYVIADDDINGISEQSAKAWQVAMNNPLSFIANITGKLQQERKPRRSWRTQSTSPSRSQSSPATGEIEMQSPRHEMEFCEVPFLVQLHLFSYLDAHSLCQAAMVSWEWNALASDHLLWKRLLCRDSAKWQEVGHGTHPAIFSEAASDLPSKEIYLRCHPQASKVFGTCTPANITSPWNLPLRMSRWFKRTFNVAVFGPGLDSLPVAQRLVFGTDAIFKPTGMTPGHHGVGSGVSIRHGDNTFNLMILYKATKAERTRASDVDEINRLLHQAPNGGVGENAAGAAANENVRAQPVAELTTRVKDMCKTVDAFLCVVDNRKPTKTSTAPLIHGMMAAAPSGQHRTPLLVMSTTGSRTEECRSCVVDEASTLRLTLLNHPWKMQSARLDSPDTIFSALDWLVEQV